MAAYTDRGTERQRERYGGVNWGAAFFGWTSALGIAALLTALLAAAGTAVAISEFRTATEAETEARTSAETVGLGGGILLFCVAVLSYFTGGYVAGRMSRFDGVRQGAGVWIWGVVAAVVLAIVGLLADAEWNLFARLDLPRIPIEEGDVTTGGIVLLVAVLVGTLLAALGGGRVGERYHRAVDEAGTHPADEPGERPTAAAAEAPRERSGRFEGGRSEGREPAGPGRRED